MAKLLQQPIAKLKEFSDFLCGRIAVHASPSWFRGCGNANHKLVPSLFRHPKIEAPEGFLELEMLLLERFRQRSVPFHDRDLADDWECLFFMQHFGVPTRLLDWSENPFIAMFFALTTVPRDATGNPCVDAAVWVLEPAAWNQTVLSYTKYSGGPLTPRCPELNGYSPRTEVSLMNSKSVAMFGTHNSQRIVAQRGVFAIFGKDTDSMECCFEANSFPEHSLVKLVIPAPAVDSMFKELTLLGYTDSVVYPDVSGLALEIRRHYEF